MTMWISRRSAFGYFNRTTSGRRGLQLERRYRAHQLIRLLLEAFSGGGALLDERGVLLRGLIHLRHRDAHLGHACALLAARVADFADDVRHALDRLHDLAHRLARLVDQAAALLDALDAGADQRLDLPGGLGRALRECAHLGSHHREAAAGFAGTRGLDGRIERQDVGLEGDAVDHADDLGDVARAVVDAAHRADHVVDEVAALGRDG